MTHHYCALRLQEFAGTRQQIACLAADLLGVSWKTGGRPVGGADSGGQRALGERTSCGVQMGVLQLAVRTGGPLSPRPSKQVASSPPEVTFTRGSAKPPADCPLARSFVTPSDKHTNTIIMTRVSLLCPFHSPICSPPEAFVNKHCCVKALAANRPHPTPLRSITGSHRFPKYICY